MLKSLLSLALALTLSLSIIPSAFAQDLTALTNADILTMVKAKLPSALIVEKINTSTCNFDTYPSVLAELKYKGVTDEVLLAMVQAPHGVRRSATPAQSQLAEEMPSVLSGDWKRSSRKCRLAIADFKNRLTIEIGSAKVLVLAPVLVLAKVSVPVCSRELLPGRV